MADSSRSASTPPSRSRSTLRQTLATKSAGQPASRRPSCSSPAQARARPGTWSRSCASDAPRWPRSRVRSNSEQQSEAPWTYSSVTLHFHVTCDGLTVPVMARVIRLSIVRYCSVISTIAGVASIAATVELVGSDGTTTGRQPIELSLPDSPLPGEPEPAADEDEASAVRQTAGISTRLIWRRLRGLNAGAGGRPIDQSVGAHAGPSYTSVTPATVDPGQAALYQPSRCFGVQPSARRDL